MMYRKIREHPSALKLYQRKLVAEGVLTEDEVQAMQVRVTWQAAMHPFLELVSSSRNVCRKLSHNPSRTLSSGRRRTSPRTIG